MAEGYPPAIRPHRLRAVEHPSARTLPRAHLEARLSPWLCPSLHDTSIDVWPVYGQGGEPTNPAAPRGSRRVVERPGRAQRSDGRAWWAPARRPPRPNTHGDVKGRMPRRLGHSTTLSPHVALTRAQPQRPRESHGAGSRPLMISLAGQTPDHQRAHVSRMRDRPVACSWLSRAGSPRCRLDARAKGRQKEASSPQTSHRSTPRV